MGVAGEADPLDAPARTNPPCGSLPTSRLGPLLRGRAYPRTWCKMEATQRPPEASLGAVSS
jgi:hypothetical protein